MNVPDFPHLSLHAMLQQVGHPELLVGSSLGGYVAALHVARGGQAQWLVLLAPALDPPALFHQDELPEEVEHHGYKKMMPLHRAFYDEMMAAQPFPDASRVPTLIVHGSQDDVVPLSISETYVQRHPRTELVVLPTDHVMADAHDAIWQHIERWLQTVQQIQ